MKKKYPTNVREMIKTMIDQEKELAEIKKDEVQNLLNILIILRPYIRTQDCPLDIDKLMKGLADTI